MTQSDAAENTDTLSELEFDIICEAMWYIGPHWEKRPNRPRCNGNSAKYLVTYHSSVACDKPISAYICHECFIGISSGECFVCNMPGEERIISCTTIKK